MEGTIATSEKLAQILELAQAPALMIQHARNGYYDEYKSPIATPLIALYQHALRCGLTDIAERVKKGDFDAADWEVDEWAKSQEAQEIFKELTAPKTTKEGKPHGQRHHKKTIRK